MPSTESVSAALRAPLPLSPPGARAIAAPELRSTPVDVAASCADHQCRHCGASVPAGLVDPTSDPQFCCSGCRTVFAMLRDNALLGYYELAQQTGAELEPALATGRDYAEFDDPAFLERYTRLDNGQRHAELLLEGVHCAACVWLVEKLPALVPGVTSCRLDYARRLAHVTWRAEPRAATSPAAGVQPAPAAAAALQPVRAASIARALDRLGYPPHPYRESERAAIARRENRDLLVRMAVAFACAGNSMLFAFALYSGVLSDMDPATIRYFRGLSVLVALPSLLWSAQIFYRGALAALHTRTPHMDLPLSLGIVLGVISGAINVLRGQGDIYFDSLTMLVFALLAARYVQGRQQQRAELIAKSAHALTPHTARRLDPDGTAHTVPSDSVAEGAHVEVLAGDTFPVDGEVVSGDSAVDKSWLTGEAAPELIGAGSAVFAGTTNLGGRVVVVAQKSGAETRAAHILAEVQRASARRAPIALLADKASAYFLVGVLIAAALAFVAWLPAGLAVAFETAIALLIVTCPCGIALATPLAVSSALGQAARAGWLIKGGAFLEALARPGLIVFDKTGTLTTGKLTLSSWEGDASLKPHVAGLEQGSSHPIARALVSALADVPALLPTTCTQRLGQGVEGIVEGRHIRVGTVHGAGAPLPEWAASAVERLAARAETPVLVSVDGAVRAVLGLGDEIRPDAAHTLGELRRLGYRLALLSGDQSRVVDAVAKQLEAASGVPGLFEHHAGDMSPEAKLAHIEAARAREGNVFMVGDGVNDAAALAAASVGIAVHGGAEASLGAAHVFGARPGVAPLLDLIRGARRALTVLHQNLAFSVVYNVLAVGLTIGGAINPIWAAVIMPLSSLTVVSHSYRRQMFRRSS